MLVKSYLSGPACWVRLSIVDTRDTSRLTGPGKQDEEFRGRGLGARTRRNPSLLLFIVVVFSFAASTVASNFSLGPEGAPTILLRGFSE